MNGDMSIVNGVYKPTYNWGAPSCSFFGRIAFSAALFHEVFGISGVDGRALPDPSNHPVLGTVPMVGRARRIHFTPNLPMRKTSP